MERYKDVGGCRRKDNSNDIRSAVASGTDNIAFPTEGEGEKHDDDDDDDTTKTSP